MTNGINTLKLEALKQTQAFYIRELKKESLTEKQRDSYSVALKTIEGIIKQKEEAGEERKHKKYMAYDHKKVVFQNSKRGY